MRGFVFLVFLIAGSVCNGQVRLDPKELASLVAVGESYSKGGALSEAALQPFRTPKLNHLIDTLIATGKRDGSILDSKYLKRPGDEELVYWYVIREIHYNRNNEKKKPQPNLDVAREILSSTIDRRWLLDNYYYRIRSGIASYFNEADLSKLDLKFDELGLTDRTEKAIFFFNVMEAVGGGRFMVLMATRNYSKILDFARRFPTFDGDNYYAFTHFDYPDFEWIGYEERESYNARHLETFYTTLFAHHKAETETGNRARADLLINKSILNRPEYFKYTSLSERLKNLRPTRE